ncbi:N5-carboxyaminoimidazole ribonucleotide synthase [Polymorphobacter glacialis]|uniref:N5-carboxyaminoimidazole ribonucleotide synthase n=1 Tax=Sandarakinorhabdus glacialis TaxID=1614636 RepID=A0A916ZIL8_9SPHN|nr:5-(carboxyamino)imidazole ribonucleotide synthase [Polymorphobacter glacialis]GGD98348.1 N5-carboxyaminoimidazole ribonucleotide synthase [Polymorphobacter glacialis]
MIAPGATIGILGGGQLGRMLALAAANMGYRVHIYAPEHELPAGDVSAEVTRAGYDNTAALDAFAAAVDVVTFEFENIDTTAIRHLAGQVPVHPGADSLEIAQDRLAEKRFVEGLGGRPAAYHAVDSRADLDAAIADLGCPAILKTRRMGYDGKGQARIHSPADAAAAWDTIGQRPAILEAFETFSHEFSVILARSEAGEIVSWPVAHNIHDNGILASSHVPAPAAIAGHIAAATALSHTVIEALGHVGVLTLEFFATPTGPIFNEMAPRVHNSGHWSIEGARTSQFENHIRAICGLPLGDTRLTADTVLMKNLLGDHVHDWHALLADPGAHLHLYGKSEIKPGRKMGHVTWL